MTQEMCDKNLDSYLSTMKFVPECHEAQEMCNKAVNKCSFVCNSSTAVMRLSGR